MPESLDLAGLKKRYRALLPPAMRQAFDDLNRAEFLEAAARMERLTPIGKKQRADLIGILEVEIKKLEAAAQEPKPQPEQVTGFWRRWKK